MDEDLELIGRQQMIDEIDRAIAVERHYAHAVTLLHAKNIALQLPTIERRPKSHWEIYVISMYDGEDCRCARCGTTGCVPYWSYCPVCGADNRGEVNEMDFLRQHG